MTIRSTKTGQKTGPRTNRKFLWMNQYGNTNLPALEFFRYDQPCSNGTLLPQEEEQQQQQQLSSFIELAKKICEFKNLIGDELGMVSKLIIT